MEAVVSSGGGWGGLAGCLWLGRLVVGSATAPPPPSKLLASSAHCTAARTECYLLPALRYSTHQPALSHDARPKPPTKTHTTPPLTTHPPPPPTTHNYPQAPFHPAEFGVPQIRFGHISFKGVFLFKMSRDQKWTPK